MKFPLYSSRYFISIGIFMLLCFAGIGLYISQKLSVQTDRISTDVATKVYQLKSNIIKGEFNGFVVGLKNANIMVSNTSSRSELLNSKRLLETQLLSQPQINTGWYAILRNAKTTYQLLRRERSELRYLSMKTYQQNWTDSLLLLPETSGPTGKLIKVSDSLHWLVGTRQRMADASLVMLALDINLSDLQHYLQSVDTAGRASVFIVDQNGYYISGPEEQLIGTKIRESLGSNAGTTRLADSVSTYEITNSSYLQLPVVRYYTPLFVAGMKWTMVIDTPLLAVDEDVKVIEKYVMILFLLTAAIVLLLIAWSQAKWQKEFMLRQEVEIIAERQQKENALLQLNSLKQKVNPHFLFNSLSSLNALIDQNPEMAKSFVLKLSRVYRYVLEAYPNGLASVADELRFVREYFFLLKIRFGDALAPLEIDVPEAMQAYSIPFMSLQTLVENAVKHNMLSKAKPLFIKIQHQGDFIVLSNNLQLRNDVRDSGKQGLNYLKSTYAYFNNQDLNCEIIGREYICRLPILKLTES